jgi:hypothetical protein
VQHRPYREAHIRKGLSSIAGESGDSILNSDDDIGKASPDSKARLSSCVLCALGAAAAVSVCRHRGGVVSVGSVLLTSGSARSKGKPGVDDAQ